MSIIYKIKEKILMNGYLRVVYSLLLLMFSPFQIYRILVFNRKTKNKKVVVFAISDFYMFEHISDFFIALKKEKNYLPILIVSRKILSHKNKWSNFLKENYSIIDEFWFGFPALLFLNINAFIETAITSYSVFCKKKVIRILYAHGLSGLGFSKNYEHVKNVKKYDYIFLTGPMQRKALEIAKKQFNVSLPKMKKIGFSFGDRMRAKNRIINRKAFINENDLNGHYTILFAPTWGVFSATKSWIDKIVKLCKDLNVDLIIRLHPLMLNGKTYYETAGIDWKKKLSDLSKEYSNCIIHMKYGGLEEAMLISDLLITDVSSVGIEYFLLDKPVIFLPADEYFKIYGKDQPIYWVRNNYEVNNILELEEAIKYYMKSGKMKFKFDLNQIVYNIDFSSFVFVKNLKDILFN